MNLTEFFLSCKWCLHPQLCRMGYTFAFGLVGVIVISYALLSTASEGTLDIVHAHAVLMATAFVWVLPVLLMLQYFPKPADRTTCMPLYKRTLLFFNGTFCAGLLAIFMWKLSVGHRLRPQSAHAWIGMILVACVMFQFIVPLVSAGAWNKIDVGLEMPGGPLSLYVGVAAVWSGLWALLGDDTLLVFVAPCVAVAVTIVRNCTTLAPGTFVFKKNQLMDASLEGAA